MPRLMLTQLQRRKLARYFGVYDVDGDGRVSYSDFERVVENLRELHGLPADFPDGGPLRGLFVRRWESLRDLADRDGDGRIDREEWLAYWEHVVEDDQLYRHELESAAGRLFDLFDADENGRIGPDEFAEFYAMFGMQQALARRVFLELDHDADGELRRDEVLDAVEEFFRGDDPRAAANLLFGPLDET